ncbi:hypothetical protein [Spirillospora albida]|uniref:hypothetical protein n=1 Tax=Spirillospora albida TaxID=58123 RepID=UPI0004C05D4F|nr:hypothetical protein [Spirillospora albida]
MRLRTLITAAAGFHASAVLAFLTAAALVEPSPDASFTGPLAELAGPASMLVIGVGPDDGPGEGILPALVCAALALTQAALLWTLLRWRLRDLWNGPLSGLTGRFRNGPVIFWLATAYGTLTFAAALLVDLSYATESGSMAGIWMMPLLGPATILWFALPFTLPGLMTLGGPVQAWVFWRLLRGRRVPAVAAVPDATAG